MAYRDFADTGDIAASRIESESALAGEPIRLGSDEWSVVEFAKNDGLWSLNPDGFPQRLARLLFGVAPPQPLANERLEALRRLAVAAWHRRVDPALVAAVRAAGFTCAEVGAVLNQIARQLKPRSTPRGLA